MLNKHKFTKCSNGIKNVEKRVSHPHRYIGRAAKEQRKTVIGISYNLCHTPCNDHAREEETREYLYKVLADRPYSIRRRDRDAAWLAENHIMLLLQKCKDAVIERERERERSSEN
jgi:hypothetical protein